MIVESGHRNKATMKTKAAQMKFIRRRSGYNLLDHRNTEGILQELKVDTVEKKL
jgi:hypothetical protein